VTWLQASVEIAKAFLGHWAWPVAVIFICRFFRVEVADFLKGIAELARRISKLKGWGAELEAANFVELGLENAKLLVSQKQIEQVKTIQMAGTATGKAANFGTLVKASPTLTDLAQSDPKFAIQLGMLHLQMAAQRAAKIEGPVPRTTFLQILERLKRDEVISNNLALAIMNLSEVSRKLSEDRYIPSRKEAEEFLLYSQAAIRELEENTK
jgi:hypothetical protein